MWKSTLKFLASLKLAVIVIIAIGVLSAWGTIVEAQYNSRIATKIVYHSPYMIITMLLLTVNLIAVIVDRYPWKRRHLGFILAHVGIITLLVGSVVTKKWGVDGSMVLGLGQTKRHVTLPETELSVWASFNGDNMTRLFSKEVDFYMQRPEQNPIRVPVQGGKEIVIDKYIPFALEQRSIVAGDPEEGGPALRFQLQNDNVNMSEWLRTRSSDGRPEVKNLGPAKIVLATKDYKPSGENEIILQAQGAKKALKFKVYSSRLKKITNSGELRAGQTIETGWMGLKFRALKYLPSAKEKVEFIALKAPTEITTSAIRVLFRDKEYWMGLNGALKLFTDSSVNIISYGNKRQSVGFDVKLEKFQIGRYQGTMRAASYESDVSVKELGMVNISMNEPMKHKGLTFYQASYHEDEQGNPIASVLSVNKDPGRWLKYLGSLMIVFGSIFMFYFKQKIFQKKEPA